MTKERIAYKGLKFMLIITYLCLCWCIYFIIFSKAIGKVGIMKRIFEDIKARFITTATKIKVLDIYNLAIECPDNITEVRTMYFLFVR